MFVSLKKNCYHTHYLFKCDDNYGLYEVIRFPKVFFFLSLLSEHVFYGHIKFNVCQKSLCLRNRWRSLYFLSPYNKWPIKIQHLQLRKLVVQSNILNEGPKNAYIYVYVLVRARVNATYL